MTADLVVFGEDWGAHPSSTQHLIRRLMPRNQVLWVNSIGLRAPRFSVHDFRRMYRKLAAANQPSPVDSGTHAGPTRVLSPLAVPLPGHPLARFANRHLLSRLVRGAMADTGIHRPILWASLPTAVDAVGSLGERAVVYYCGDDFSALAGVDHEPVSEMEDELVRRADLVLTASLALAAKFPQHKTLLVPHGVDVDLFSTPAARPADLPEGPVAGFYGALAEWIDLDLIAFAARSLPHWTFFLIGPIQRDVSVLKREPNIVLAGPRPHADLPGYVQNWTVSMLPFRDTPQIRACNPLKLREYLASGKPVVATDFPALDTYRDLLTAVSRPEHFVTALMMASVDARDSSHARLRRERVAHETWEAAALRIADALDSL